MTAADQNETGHDVDTRMVEWDLIIQVFREASPKLGKYGGDKGGSTPGMIDLLRNREIVGLVAGRIGKILIQHQVATASARQIIEAADKARNDQLRKLVDEIKARKVAPVE